MSSRILPKLGASKRIFATVLMFATVAIATGSAHAQCPAPVWLPDVPGTNGFIWAMTWWDRDAGGPLPPVLVVGGGFTQAGGAAANRIAMFDPITGQWSPLGSGMNDLVLSLAALPSGELVAGGTFTTAGGVAANRIARWNGMNWAPFGAGITGSTTPVVYALATLPNGHLVAGGAFARAGTTWVSNVARWNGSTWSALGNGLGAAGELYSSVQELITSPTGDVIAGGGFQYSGGQWQTVPNVARWNGINWVPLGAEGGNVAALTRFPNGDIVVGRPSVVGTNDQLPVVRWNGTDWTSLGTIEFDGVYDFAFLPNGNLIAADNHAIRAWNGSTWSDLESFTQTSNATIYALQSAPDGEIFLAGSFSASGGVPASNFSRRTAGTAPSLTEHPVGGSVCALGSASFSVMAYSTTPIQYQWQVADTTVPGGWADLVDGPISVGGQPFGIASGTHSAALYVSAAVDESNGVDAVFRCVTTDDCGSAASHAATLLVFPNGSGDGDVNGVFDGRDISSFVNILTMGSGPGPQDCAVDMDSSGNIDSADLPLFIDALLSAS